TPSRDGRAAPNARRDPPHLVSHGSAGEAREAHSGRTQARPARALAAPRPDQEGARGIERPRTGTASPAARPAGVSPAAEGPVARRRRPPVPRPGTAHER